MDRWAGLHRSRHRESRTHPFLRQANTFHQRHVFRCHTRTSTMDDAYVEIPTTDSTRAEEITIDIHAHTLALENDDSTTNHHHPRREKIMHQPHPIPVIWKRPSPVTNQSSSGARPFYTMTRRRGEHRSQSHTHKKNSSAATLAWAPPSPEITEPPNMSTRDSSEVTSRRRRHPRNSSREQFPAAGGWT